MWMNGPSTGPSGRDLERAMTRSMTRAQRAADRPSGGAVMWRWMTGAPINGIPRTDAGWFRHGADDLTPAHTRAHRWDYLPRWKRAGWRGGPTLATPAAVGGWIVDPATTLVVVVVAFVAGVGIGTWRIRRAVQFYRLQRQIARPLAVALSRTTGENPSRILAEMRLPLDYATNDKTQVVIPLPDDHRPHHITEVKHLVGERLGGEWTGKRSTHAPYTITFMHKPAPPTFVPFRDVVELIMAEGSQSRILQGIGTSGDPVWLDFDGDIAHLAANVGTGGGKTSFIQFLIAQLAYHGVCDFVVIDVKMDGYEGEIDEIPGMRIYQDLQSQWDAIEAVYNEMEQRYLAKRAAKRRGEDIKFPRKLLLLEEQNVFAKRSKKAWDRIKTKDDPPKPPVMDEFVSEMLFMGRAVDINLISMFQRLTADAAGGTEMRDQYGMKTLSRHSHQAWDSLVGTRPRPPMSPITGRWITVMHGVQKWVQVPYGTTAELMEFVRSRPASVTATDISRDLPPTASPKGEVRPSYTFRRPLREAGEGEGDPATPAAVEAPKPRLSANEALGLAEEEAVPEKLYTLQEAEKDGVLPVPYERAKKHRQNDGAFPPGVKDGRAKKYTAAELTEYYESKESGE